MQFVAEIWFVGQRKPPDPGEYDWCNAFFMLCRCLLAVCHQQTVHMPAIVQRRYGTWHYNPIYRNVWNQSGGSDWSYGWVDSVPICWVKINWIFFHSIQAICAVWLLWYFLRRPVACWCKLCAQKQPKCFHSHWFWCHFWFRFSGSYLASSSKIISYKFQIWWALYCRAHSFFSSWSTPINSDRKHTRQKEIFRMRYFNRQIDDKFDISVSSTLSTRGICFLHRADEFWYWFILRQSIDLIIII